MRRLLFNVLTLSSLLLCVATCALWSRGTTKPTRLKASYPRFGLFLNSSGGRMSVGIDERQRSVDSYGPEMDALDHWHPYRPIGLFEDERPPTWEVFLGSVTVEQSGAVATYRLGWASAPLWGIILPTVVLPLTWALAFYRWRRLNDYGRCVGCGYDLRATPGRCPECGMVVAKAA